ncbi:MAG: tripartite tricarboxylate transporter TctB family protein [Betaproteobacteria bacterium]|nr:tripartite tricarboxylate transporter TctB family protein [Betaproteobacteria bacterium]
MKIKSQQDFWSGLMFLVSGALFAWGAIANYSFGSSARPGPGYFPFGLGIILALLGALIMFEALTIETEDGEPIGDIAWKPLLVILGSVFVFGLLLPLVGMLIALPLLVITSSLASEQFTWKGTLTNGVFLTGFSWLVFIKGLGLTIPLLPAFLQFAG